MEDLVKVRVVGREEFPRILKVLKRNDSKQVYLFVVREKSGSSDIYIYYAFEDHLVGIACKFYGSGSRFDKAKFKDEIEKVLKAESADVKVVTLLVFCTNTEFSKKGMSDIEFEFKNGIDVTRKGAVLGEGKNRITVPANYEEFEVVVFNEEGLKKIFGEYLYDLQKFSNMDMECEQAELLLKHFHRGLAVGRSRDDKGRSGKNLKTTLIVSIRRGCCDEGGKTEICYCLYS